MRHFLLLCFACFVCGPVFAQVTTPDKMMSGSTTIRDKLVELALQNPDLEVADHEVKIAKYNLSAAKGWWAENLSFSFNANEYSLKTIGKSSDNTTGRYYTLYPLYNMGINIPIGGIFSKPQAVKAARERVAIAQASRAGKYNQIKTSVLSAYQNYLTNRELLTVQSQVTEGVYNDFLQAKQKFRNGQVSVDEYNKAAKQYHDQLINRISAEHDFNLAKIQLEALIGVPLSTVLTDDQSGQPASDTTGVH